MISKEELAKALACLPAEIDGYVWLDTIANSWLTGCQTKEEARDRCVRNMDKFVRAFADGSVWAPGHGWVREAREKVTFACKRYADSDEWQNDVIGTETEWDKWCAYYPRGNGDVSYYAVRFSDGRIWCRNGGFRRGEQAKQEDLLFSPPAPSNGGDPDIKTAAERNAAYITAEANARKIDRMMRRPLLGQIDAIVALRNDIRRGAGWFDPGPSNCP